MGAVDGPGLRFVAFAQGCPLRCAYCHNPETWAADGGSEFTIEQLVEKAERGAPLHKKGRLHAFRRRAPHAARVCRGALRRPPRARLTHGARHLRLLRRREEAVREVLRHTGLVICDVKFARAGLFKIYCGGELSRTLDFLALTEEMRVPLWIRQVVVPSINDAPSDARELGRIAASYRNVEKLELLPFRKLCIHKYEALGIDFPLRGVPECGADKLCELQEVAERECAGV